MDDKMFEQLLECVKYFGVKHTYKLISEIKVSLALLEAVKKGFDMTLAVEEAKDEEKL